MLNKLRDLITGASGKTDDGGEDDVMHAVAALLIEAGRMDERFDGKERAAIHALLAQRFALKQEDLDRIVSAAEQRVEGSEQYFPFTNVICKRMSGAERIELIEMLWRVVYADGELDAYEDALIRQVAALIYVDDRDRAAARQRALAAIGSPGPA